MCLEEIESCIKFGEILLQNQVEINILDATGHLSGMRTYSPHTPRTT